MKSNQVALVTGASSGIGRATAELLAAQGFTLFGTSPALTQVARSYTLLPMDVRSDAFVEAAIQFCDTLNRWVPVIQAIFLMRSGRARNSICRPCPAEAAHPLPACHF